MSRGRKNLSVVLGAVTAMVVLFGLFVYSNWRRIDPERWFWFGAVTAAVFGILLRYVAEDLRRPKAFAVFMGMFVAHMIFCIHFMAQGVYMRPLFYLPIAIGEMAITIFALIILGGARFEAFGNRHHQGPHSSSQKQ